MCVCVFGERMRNWAPIGILDTVEHLNNEQLVVHHSEVIPSWEVEMYGQ